MEISIGRIVLYTLTEEDAVQVNRRRTDGPSIAARIKNNSIPYRDLHGEPDNPLPSTWPLGAQAHIGNLVSAGDVFPMMVTRRWGVGDETGVNGQVFLDGNDTIWATSVCEGTGGHTWSWPPRV